MAQAFNPWEMPFGTSASRPSPFGWGSPIYPDAPLESPTAQPVPVTPQAPPPASGYSGPKDFTSLIRYWQQQHPASAPDMPGLIAFLNSNGVPVSTAMHNGMASDDKILYNGQTYDLGTSLGGPGAAWFSDFGPMGNDAGGSGIDESYLSPFTKQFTMPAGGQLPIRRDVPAFSFPDFKAPSSEDVLSDPGYQFRLDQGRKAVEYGASAKGLLNSGGTLADVLGFGQGLASQEYGQVFNRAFNVYDTNRNNAAATYATNYGTQFMDPYNLDTTRANTIYNRASDVFNNEKDTFYKNQDSPFSKLYQLANLGASNN